MNFENSSGLLEIHNAINRKLILGLEQNVFEGRMGIEIIANNTEVNKFPFRLLDIEAGLLQISAVRAEN